MKENTPSLETYRARAHVIEGATPEIMWMPGGRHRITCEGPGKKPTTAELVVDASVAAAANASLQAHNASGQRAFLDFDHAEKEASAWPTGFAWRETPKPGVYMQVEWSSKGREAVEGKVYRAFSPAFHASKKSPEKVVGAPFCMGGLTNDPAFTQILPFWAKNAGAHSSGSTNNQTEDSIMTEQETAALQAKNQQTEQELSTLKARQAERENEIATLKARAQQAEEALKAQRKAAAKRSVDEAVAKGIIPPQNIELRARYERLLEDDPANEVLLANHAPAAALGGSVAHSGVEIKSEDVVTLLKAYHAEQNPREAGALYARTLRARMVKEDECGHVLLKANTLGTVAGTIVTQRTLDLLKISFPALERISTNFSDEGASYGATISTRLVSIPAVQTYSTSTGYAATAATTTDVDVAINAHRYVAVSFNANEIAGTRRLLFGEQDQAMHYAIGKDLVDAIYALMTAGNYTETAVTAALVDFGRNKIIEVGVAMQSGSANRNANNGTRTALLSPSYHGKLAEDTVVVSNLYNNGSGGAIASGVLPMVHGFLPVEAPNLITTGNLVGFAMRADAVAMAVRPANDYAGAIPGLPATALIRVVTNPETGLSVQQTMYTDHLLGVTTMRLAWMRGQAVGNQKAGQRIISG